MRELILQRIRTIKAESARMSTKDEGFSKRDGRWNQLNVEGIPIRDIIFSELTNDQLIYIFEHIIRRYYTQR